MEDEELTKDQVETLARVYAFILSDNFGVPQAEEEAAETAECGGLPLAGE